MSLNRVLSFPIWLLVRAYQLILSPWLPNACRYTPTCSQYMLEALEEWGPIKGTWLGLKRLSTCHPWGGHGHDPVPKRSGKNTPRRTA